MKKFRNLFVVVLLTVVSIFMFGCQKKTVDKFVVPEGGYDGSEVTITFYHTMSATTLQPVLETYIKEFNKIYLISM